jgi:hypothetical protein
MIASDNGRIEIVQLLLEAGADKEAEDEVRKSPERKNHTRAHMCGCQGGSERMHHVASSHRCSCS